VGFDNGGQLTEAVRKHPFRVILFDEIEKAHPDIFNILLQILEDGRLTDGQGRTVDFRNTLVIMTSNLGTSADDREQLGFLKNSSDDDSVQLRSTIEDALKQTFRPEFLNRIDEIIIFESLTTSQISQIVEMMVADVELRLTEHEISIGLTTAAKDWLVHTGFDKVYGARPLRRAVLRYLENPLAKKVLSKTFVPGDHIRIDVGSKGLAFDKAKPERAVASSASSGIP
jgi:ATP-dependent Clp protease ATP-binding subunit ClpC